MFSRSNTSAVTAEFIGTFALVLAVLTVTKSSLNLPFFVSMTAGLSAASMMLLFGRMSGAQLNPAITLGLLSLKKVSTVRALAYIVAQLIAGIAAYYLFAYFSGQRWHSTGQFEMKSFVAEATGTFLFSLGWAAVVAQKLEASKAAALVGLSLALAMLAMSSAGPVMLNPAIALGSRSWIWASTVLAPVVGAIAGFQLYHFWLAAQATPGAPGTDRRPTKITSTQIQSTKLRR